MIEGQKVTYAGDTDPYNEVGALGKVVALSGTAAHVQWTSGPKAGAIDLVEQHELVLQRMANTVTASSFDMTISMVTPHDGLRVRATYDEQGEDGVLNALSESGHLAMLSEYAEEAVALLASRVRQDPTLGTVLSELEADEADNLISRVAAVLLSDRLGEA